jgi:hypothetical protein
MFNILSSAGHPILLSSTYWKQGRVPGYVDVKKVKVKVKVVPML